MSTLSVALTISLLWSPATASWNSSAKPDFWSKPAKTTVKKDELIARLENVIPRLMKDGDVPGLSIAVIRNGKLAWNHAFGVKNAETKEPVTEDTVFEAASLSKPVFAYAVLKLVDSGKLDLDTPLVKYLNKPYLKNDDRVNLITSRRVLTHTTGFPNWRPRGGDLKIFFNPGERFSYSGEGFVYLQKVVEHITRQPLNDCMTKLVFEPLGMSSSSYVWQERYDSLKATGHDAAGDPTEKRKPAEANAAASLQTTARDYARFMIAIMSGTGLKEATIKEMLRPQIKVDEGCENCVATPPTGKLSPIISWGLGVGLQQMGEGLSFWHWGDNGDVHCFMLGYPKPKLGIAVFTNSGNGMGIIPEILSAAISGKQPAITWIGYEPYNSPGRKLFHDILARGPSALSEYREQRRSKTPLFVMTEVQVNRLGYGLLGKKRVQEAIEVFKMNTEDFPNSSNTYDSLGEAYMVAGEKELAIKNYEKSIELNPNNTNGIEMLKKLRASSSQ